MGFAVDSTITGLHSRSEETVRTSRNYDRGRATKQELESAFEADAKNLVALELEAGFTMISDGQLRWQDFIRPFSESLTGLKSGADLSRWYDTNSFYRKPSIVKQIKPPKDASFLTNYIESSALDFAKNQGRKKISIPGPYTLASLVTDEYYESAEERLDVFAKALGNLVSKLPEIGFDIVQINEPSLVYRYGKSALTSKKELSLFISTFSKYFSGQPVDVYLHTYFGDCSKILGKLLELKGVKGIGIDFTQTSLDSIEDLRFENKALGCGCVDGRNSLVEKPEWITKFCEEAVRTLKPNGLVVLPSSELKYLPRSYADEKLRSIGEACDSLRKLVN